MKQTVNPVHLLYNNNRLHRHIVWAPYANTNCCVMPSQLNAHRILEILVFTAEQVEDYVGKFTEGDQDADAKDTIYGNTSAQT